ncbi:MAG: Uma2 family endonuclease [Anaerolineae bacterium]|nr:Uma2 family endonuclease [Anaerolineae bacterium]
MDTAVASPAGVMSLEAFIERCEREGLFELIDGEIVPVTPNVLKHNQISGRLYLRMGAHVEGASLGYLAYESPYVLEYQSNWLRGARVPDLLFVNAVRFAAYTAQTPDWGEKPLILVPDLVIEIISPTDKFVKVMDKARLYLRDGVRLVWLIDPQSRTVNVLTADGGEFLYDAGSTLTGGDVLPELRLDLHEIFA